MTSESTWIDTIEPAVSGNCSDISNLAPLNSNKKSIKRIRRDEPEIHGVRIIGGDEVEGEEGNGKKRNEPVYTGALVRRENFPPFYGAIS
ncbi:hypothetical protein RJ639_037422 [Escallonia herrerae]|uniref:Uncharacterized protein n=1 Tax=Escallonia herrerae TaxID=1293975 RepID=A0AA88WQN3_9ASTE|nr:hypothetical protein RJ639_037422 [Escallonia herrerae]